VRHCDQPAELRVLQLKIHRRSLGLEVLVRRSMQRLLGSLSVALLLTITCRPSWAEEPVVPTFETQSKCPDGTRYGTAFLVENPSKPGTPALLTALHTVNKCEETSVVVVACDRQESKHPLARPALGPGTEVWVWPEHDLVPPDHIRELPTATNSRSTGRRQSGQVPMRRSSTC